ncbi:OmpA family protein [Leptospira licerasiae]|uniref:OmpA family protein n=1 Tax=Leptospira licerasiae TaxID=447106 RepID=UPI003017BAAA
MNRLLPVLLSSVLLLFSSDLLAEERIIEGKLLQFGRMLGTGNDFIQVLSNDLSPELSRLHNQTIRVLCQMRGENCDPIRYETYPFSESKGLADWTLKRIPNYVNRGYFAFNPTVTPDGQSIFWTVYSSKGKSGTQRIWFAEKDDKGFWRDGKEMPAPLNNDLNSAVIAVLPSNNELFVFGSFGDDEATHKIQVEFQEKKEDLRRNTRDEMEFRLKEEQLAYEYLRKLTLLQNKSTVPLYKSYKEKGSWSYPKAINFPDFSNIYLKNNTSVFGGSTLSSSGRILIYSVQQPDSYGKLDLYVSIQKADGSFAIGKNLGEVVNTSSEETAPFLAGDDRTLYFCSDGHKGLSVYVTKRIGEGWDNWTKPIEVSANLKGVNFFSIPVNSDWAYVSKEGQLYMAYLPRDFRPNPVVVIKGKVLDEEGNPLGAEVHYESLTRLEKRGSAKSDSKTGSFSLVLPYGEKYGFYAEKPGHLSVSKNIDLTESKQEDAKLDVEFRLPALAVGRQILLNNLFFETNKFEISKDSEPELDRLANFLKSNPKLKISVEGHTDNVGKKEHNLELSESRAKAVANYLISRHGIDSLRVRTQGFGDSQPISSNDNASERQKNRRVVLQIVD